MTDFEKDCDATLETARKLLGESERLSGECEAAFRAKREWEQASGIDAEKRQRFFAALTPEDRKKVEDENQRFALEVAHDLERAVAAAAPKKGGGGKRRKYI